MPPKILFISYFLHERPTKIASTLNLIGVKPHLIVVNPVIPHGWEIYFSSITILAGTELSTLLRNNSYDVIHLFTKYVDHLTVELLKLNVKFLYDYKDIFPGTRSNGVDDDELCIQKTILDVLIARQIPFTFKDGQYQRYLNYRNLKDIAGSVYLPDWVWPGSIDSFCEVLQPVAYNRKHSLVFIGNFSIAEIEPEDEGTDLKPIIRAVTDQGLTFNLHPFRHDLADLNSELFRGYNLLSAERSEFKIWPRIQANQLHRVLRNYGWGIHSLAGHHFRHLRTRTVLSRSYAGFSARVIDLLSGGLPIICDEDMGEVADWIRCYEIGIIVKHGQISNLAKQIDDTEYSVLRRNVESFVRDMLSPDFWGKKLLEYYDRFM